ncbi:MAG TPA: hypothetical protein VKB54_07010 [Solirubrobacteraceae bacterium]|nr:hypothetical protein [Solirubrobacteraceae bacterium]
MRTATCRSCGAQIVWAETEKGRRMPVDADPNPLGQIVLRGHGTTPLAICGVPDDAYPGEPRYASHFQTCPQAGDWRRRRPPERASTRWRIVSAPDPDIDRTKLAVELEVTTASPEVVAAIEDAASRAGIELERIEEQA